MTVASVWLDILEVDDREEDDEADADAVADVTLDAAKLHDSRGGYLMKRWMMMKRLLMMLRRWMMMKRLLRMLRWMTMMWKKDEEEVREGIHK